MDLAEFFTRSARDVIPAARERGLLFLFDYRGPFVDLQANENGMRASLRRLQNAALDLLDNGFIFLSAQTDWSDAGHADVAVSVACTGGRANDERIGEVLHRLGLIERSQDAGQVDGARIADGVCPLTGFRVAFAANRSDGILFALDVNAPAKLLDTQPPPHADGARAWLVSDVHGAQQSIARRLQRLGWATSQFKSPHQALEKLLALSSGMTRPSLVIGTQSELVTVASMHALQVELPQHTQVILTVPGAQSKAEVQGVDTRPWPFSPRELEDITRRASEAAATFSGETMPAPLSFQQRPHALVVDDNPVNLLVAAGLLQVAGFEVRTAAGGEDAIARCREHAPQLVLMDVHMPGMDGLQTTRRLRALQQAGVLTEFRIVAATADAVDIGLPACMEAGMDGYLSKPLTLQAIEREVRRLLPSLRFALTSQ